jgi:hypothetical protein
MNPIDPFGDFANNTMNWGDEEEEVSPSVAVGESVLEAAMKFLSGDSPLTDEENQAISALAKMLTKIESKRMDSQKVVGATEDEIDEDDPEYWLTQSDVRGIIFRAIFYALRVIPNMKSKSEGDEKD